MFKSFVSRHVSTFLGSYVEGFYGSMWRASTVLCGGFLRVYVEEVLVSVCSVYTFVHLRAFGLSLRGLSKNS